MKKFRVLGAAFIAAAFLSSCTMVMPAAATSNAMGSKVGSATQTVILGLSFGQDGSVAKAAKEGGITKISTVDVKHTNYLMLFQTYETIVTGK